jgi:acetyltransferase-like isoleucine patch superfamily enzyme
LANRLGRILRIFAWLIPVYQARASLVRHSGVKVGKGVFIGNLVYFDGAHPDYIEIEDEAAIGPGAIIIAHSGGSPYQSRTGIYHEAPKKVVLKRGSWVGSGAVILPGVVVGECSIVAAGAVVSQDVPPYTVVAGNPARAVRKLDQPGGSA